MYTQTQKALAILLLTSLVLQSCGTNLMLGEQRAAMREKPHEAPPQAKAAALAASQPKTSVPAPLHSQPKTGRASDSLPLQPEARQAPPYTPKAAWKAQEQRLGRPLPLVDCRGLLGGGGGDDEGAHEEKQNGLPPHGRPPALDDEDEEKEEGVLQEHKETQPSAWHPQEPQVMKALWKLLQEGHIRNTAQLTEAFNDAQSQTRTRLPLTAWISAYIARFELPMSALWQREYLTLAGLQPRSAWGSQLYCQYLLSLAQKIKALGSDRAYQGQVLSRAIDTGIAQLQEAPIDSTEGLLALGQALLDALSTEPLATSQDQYWVYEHLLYALYKVQTLVRRIDAHNGQQTDQALTLQAQHKLAALQRNARYYPIAYHCAVMQQRLQLPSLPEAPLLHWQAPQSFRGLRALPFLEQDPFYQDVQSLLEEHSRLASEPQPSGPSTLADALEARIKEQAQAGPAGKVLCYSSLTQLTHYALGEDEPRALHSVACIADLLTHWYEDTELLEGLLDSLGMMATRASREVARQARAALEQLVQESQAPAAASSGRSGPLAFLRASLRRSQSADAAPAADEGKRRFPSWSPPRFRSSGKQAGSTLQHVVTQWCQPSLASKLSAFAPTQEPAHNRLPHEEDSLFKDVVEGILSGTIRREQGVWRAQSPLATAYARQGAPAAQLVHHLPFKPDHYVPRAAAQQQLEEQLASKGVSLITGHGGAGKTTLAAAYAHQQKEGKLVHWLLAETPSGLVEEIEKIATAMKVYFLHLKKAYKDDPVGYVQQLSRRVYHQLEGRPLLLVLDNAEEATKELVKALLGSKPEEVQVIITAKDDKYLLEYRPIRLAAFLPDEGAQYLQARWEVMDYRPSPQEQAALLEAVGLIPLGLKIACSHIHEYGMSIQEYIESLAPARAAGALEEHDLLNLQVRLGLARLSAQGQLLLRYASYLDAAHIPTDLLEALLGGEDRQRQVLRALSKLSLVGTAAGSSGVQIHREVQRACRQYRGWKEGADMEEPALLQRLVEVLAESMPQVEDMPDARWEEGKRYAPHGAAVVVAATHAAIGPQAALALLLARIGEYHNKAQSSFKEGLHYHEQALAMRQRLFEGQNHVDVANSLLRLGVACKYLGHAQQALEYLEQALEMFRVVFAGQNHPDLAGTLNNLSVAYLDLGKAQQAKKYSEQALEMRQALFEGQNHPDVAGSLINLGRAYQALGKKQQALHYSEQGLEMYRTLFEGLNHPKVANALVNVGWAYLHLGDAQEGIESLKQALEMYRALFEGLNHPQVAMSLLNLGRAYLRLDDAQQALKYLEQALEMYRTLFEGQNHPILASSLNSVGNAYQALGQGQEALAHKKQALEMRQALFEGQHHPDLAGSLNNVGVAYEKLGQVQEGLQYYEQALEMRRTLFEGQNHPDVARSLRSVAWAYLQLGDEACKQQNWIEARRHLDACIRHYEEALDTLLEEHRDLRRSTCQNLGCMYHVAALQADEEESQDFLDKATATFEAGIAASDSVEAGLYTDYANYLLATGQPAAAHHYLSQAIASDDTRQCRHETPNHKARHLI